MALTPAEIQFLKNRKQEGFSLDEAKNALMEARTELINRKKQFTPTGTPFLSETGEPVTQQEQFQSTMTQEEVDQYKSPTQKQPFLERFMPGRSPESRLKAIGRGALKISKPIESGARLIGEGLEKTVQAFGAEPLPEEAIPQLPRQLIQKAEEALSDEEAGIIEKGIEFIPEFFSGVKGAQAARFLTKEFAKVMPKVIGKITPLLTAAGEGAGFVAGEKAVKGELPTKEELTTGAAVGAAFPVVGKTLQKGKEFLGKAIPEALYKSAIKLKPNQKESVAKTLEQIGSNASAETAEQYLLSNRIFGTAKEVASKLKDLAKNYRKEKLNSLKQFRETYFNNDVLKLADESLKATKEVPGREKINKEILDLYNKANKGEVTLSDIDKLKTLSDDVLDIFTISGDVKAGNIKKGLANIRESVKEFIENEAAKKGATNIKELNQNVILNNTLSNAIKGQSVGAGGNAMLKVAETLLTGGVISGGIAAGGFDRENIMKTLGTAAAVLLGAKAMTPSNRIKIAEFLSTKLNEGEAGVLLKILQGERNFSLKEKKVIQEIKPKIEEFKLLPAPKSDIKTQVFSEGKAIQLPKETKPIDFKKAGTAKVPNDLIKEAKKYKSADDFIKAQGTPVYHGTKGDSFGGNVVYFTPDRQQALDFGRVRSPFATAEGVGGLNKKLKVIDTYVSPDARIKNVPFEPGDHSSMIKARNDGYDGVRYQELKISGKGSETSDTIAIFNKNKIKTKSQLKEIWEKAQEKVESPLIQEAKKYKTADEFVEAQGMPLFHGTSKKFDITKSKPGERGMFGKGVYFADNRAGTVIREGGTVIEAVLPKNAKVFKTNYDKEINKFLDKEGFKGKKPPFLSGNGGEDFSEFMKSKEYDAIILNKDKGKTIIVLNPKILKTKSQLKEIWKQANK